MRLKAKIGVAMIVAPVVGAIIGGAVMVASAIGVWPVVGFFGMWACYAVGVYLIGDGND